jgi:RNA polymerase sigma-70 factor (ECF subfamily)
MGRPGHEAGQERRWMRRLAEGDMGALAHIYDAHARRLFGLALWLTGSRDGAEDVLQSVFLKLAGRGADLLAVRQPHAYLLRMTRNEAYETLSRRDRRREAPLEEALSVPDEVPPPDRIASLDLARALSGLPPEQREVIYLHLFEGLTFREAGHVAGVSLFTAASRYRLALKRMRGEFTPVVRANPVMEKE